MQYQYLLILSSASIFQKHFSDNNPSLLHMDKYVIVIVVNVISNHIWILPDVYSIYDLLMVEFCHTSYTSLAAKVNAPWVFQLS